MVKYDPDPPFGSGSPENAERVLVEGVRTKRKAVQDRRTEAAKRAGQAGAVNEGDQGPALFLSTLVTTTALY